MQKKSYVKPEIVSEDLEIAAIMPKPSGVRTKPNKWD